ncbi:MAG: hypothetical protein EOO40_12270, partial [Deltaproteobacteria bacterium]
MACANEGFWVTHKLVCGREVAETGTQLTTHLAMLGATFRRVGQTTLAQLMLADEAARRRLHLACGCLESVYLATCNRVEVVLALPPEVSVPEARRRLYGFFYEHSAQLGRDVLA